MKAIEFKNLQIDKENKDVSYSDETHVYWEKETGLQCISVTTLIGQFTTFDAFFWSRYKALEAVMTNEDFQTIKPQLLDKKEFKEEYLEEYGIDKEEFEEALAAINAEWDEKRETACTRGNEIHLKYELKTLAEDYSGIEKFDVPRFYKGENFSVRADNIIEEGHYVLPELLVSRISKDGTLRIAGQADLVIIDGTDVYILDYKTNREIKKKSFYDRQKRSSQRMKYPLNHLDDVNFFHYTMQLSTYGWMIEKNNPHLTVKGLFILHHDHKDKKTVHECEYRKTDVERMLVYHKKQEAYKQHKKNNKKWAWVK